MRTQAEYFPEIGRRKLSLENRERSCWIALAVMPGVGARRHRMLIARFGSARAVWTAPLEALAEVAGLADKPLAAIVSARGSEPLPAAERLCDWAENGPWQVICLPQQEYPDPLREMYDPPAAIWVNGTIPAAPAVAIVGSRRATPYGLRVARRVAEDLAAAGVTVVSGLARGIDTAAHSGALAAGGPTVAVLGCGIDQVYPPENRSLFGAISASGALVSELPPGFGPLRGNFPARNRLISGLAAVTIVVEAGEKSGALITADLALEQGREVMVVPGNITSPASIGCNRLIAQGARPLLSSADVFEALSMAGSDAPRAQTMDRMVAGETSPDRAAGAGGTQTPESCVLASVSDGGSGLDEIVAATGLAIPDVLVALTSLQLSGRVEAVPGGRFVSFSQRRK